MDLNEITQIQRIFSSYKIDEVYNFAAQSFVKSSFSNPLTTADTTAIGRVLMQYQNYLVISLQRIIEKHTIFLLHRGFVLIMSLH